MKILKQVNETREFILSAKRAGKTTALVPTMGALHEGHLSLVRKAKSLTDLVAVSIFVNPLQFNVKDDLVNYPKTLEADIELLQSVGADLLFAPTVEEIYPDFSSDNPSQCRAATVKAGSAADGFCGATRPGHFDGVVTVVSMLFNIMPVEFAVFGEKDYQQLKVIEQMVSDLHIGVKIVPGELIRDSFGLALSSRNVRLSASDYKIALAIPRILLSAQQLVDGGVAQGRGLVEKLREEFSKEGGISIDYLDIVDTETLQPLEGKFKEGQILFAGFVGPVRLIDNVRVKCS